MLLKSPSQVLAYSLEPVRKAHYILELSDNKGEPLPNDAQLHISGLGGISDTIDSTTYVLFNSGFEYPSGHSPTNVNIELRFFADTNQKVFKFFTKWRKSIRNNETDAYGLYGSIVGQGRVKLFGPSERDGPKDSPQSPTTPILEIKLVDVWPKTLKIGDLSSDGDDTATASFTIDLSVGELSFEN